MNQKCVYSTLHPKCPFKEECPDLAAPLSQTEKPLYRTSEAEVERISKAFTVEPEASQTEREHRPDCGTSQAYGLPCHTQRSDFRERYRSEFVATGADIEGMKRVEYRQLRESQVDRLEAFIEAERENVRRECIETTKKFRETYDHDGCDSLTLCRDCAAESALDRLLDRLENE